jgi:citrate lyase beta subunit
MSGAKARATSHVVYGGAHLFSAKTADKLGALARAAFEKYAGTEEGLHAALGVTDPRVRARALDKLQKRPVEDIRIDFEDGYGARPEEEELRDAERTAKELAAALAGRPSDEPGPSYGIRIRAIRPETSARVLRTLDVFYKHITAAGGRVPEGFVVTLPKVRSAAEVSTLVEALSTIERALGVDKTGIELMAETKEAAEADALASFIRAGDGRVRSLHLGAYDFLSELGVLARSQRLHHPYTDALRVSMKLVTADTEVATFDGATTVLPIESHKAKDGGALSAAQQDENRARVHGAFATHIEDVTASLDKGFFASWILYPAQLVSHAVAVSAFYVAEMDSARARLSNFVAEASRATAVGTSFDDRATARGLVAFFARGLASSILVPADLGALEPHLEHVLAQDVDALVAASNRTP